MPGVFQMADGSVVAVVGDPAVHRRHGISAGGGGQEVSSQQLLAGRVEVRVPSCVGRPGRRSEDVGGHPRPHDVPARVEGVPPELWGHGAGDPLGVEDPYVAPFPPVFLGQVQ